MLLRFPPPRPFAVSDVPGCALWLDAADLPAGSVARWADKSPARNHAAQASGVLQPTSGARQINGLNAVDFATQYLTLASPLAAAGGLSAFTVCVGDAATFGAVLGGASGSFVLRVTSQRLAVVRSNSAVLLTGTTNLLTATPYLLYAETSNAGNAGLLNGGSEGSNATSASYTADTTLVGTSLAGDGTTLSQPFDGGLGELAVFTRVLTPTERNVLGRALARKWGLTWLDT